MRLTTILPVLIAASLSPLTTGCRVFANDYHFDAQVSPNQPAQVSVRSIEGSAVVSWSAVPDAQDYVVYLGSEFDAVPTEYACDDDDDTLSPCVIAATLVPGQVYYVRVAAFFEEGETVDVLELPALAVRPGFTSEPEGPMVWAGPTRIVGEGGVELTGAWFSDSVDTTHECAVFWGTGESGDGDSRECTPEDFTESANVLDNLNHEYHESKTHYPILDVGADDGRFGQALTTVIRL